MSKFIVNTDMLRALLVLGYELGLEAPDDGLDLALTLRASPAIMAGGASMLVEIGVEATWPHEENKEEFSISLDGVSVLVTPECEDNMDIASCTQRLLAAVKIKRE